ncbi:MAG: DUF4270 family protein [Bacteroidia bacterium]
MKNTIQVWLLAIVAAAIFFVAGCEKPILDTGINVLPQGDLIGLAYSDTTTIIMETQRQDSFNTYRATRQLFGNFIDPHFGKVSAATYTEFLARSGLNFGDKADLIFDSLVLFLNIDGYYGRIQSEQTLHVYELTEALPDTNVIYSSTHLAYDASRDLVKGYKLTFQDDDELGLMRLRLDDALGKKLLFASGDTLSDRDLFNELFKGLYIGTDPVSYLSREPGAIFSFFAISNDSRMLLYYQEKDPDTTTYTSKNEPFLITGSTPRYHSLKRTDENEGILPEYFSNPDTSTFYEFVEGGGLDMKVFVKFPYIDKIEESAISKADLVIHVDQQYLGSQRRYLPPFQLESIFADENGNELMISGQPVYVSAPALYNEATGTYTITLTNYVQQVVGGSRPNYGLFLVPNNRAFQVNRAAIGGVGNPDLKPQLQLIYANLPE